MTIIVTPSTGQFTEFYDLLLQELPGCTLLMVNKNLLEVAREFCRRTSAWRETLTAVDTVSGQAAYTLVPPVDSEVVRVTELIVNDILLWRHDDRRKAATDTETEPTYTIDEPPFTLDENLDQITLNTDEIPTADATGGLVVEAVLTPTAGATTLPSFLFTQYSETLRYGTLARLMKMGKKPWGDRPLAVDYEGRWNSALNFAAYQAQVGNTRRRLRTKSWG